MGVHSGKFGVVDGLSTIRNWSVNDTMSPQRGSASNTKFGMFSRPGIRAWDGSYQFFGHTPPAMPGDQIAFVGYSAPDDDVSGVGHALKGDALVENAQIDWDFAGGSMLSGQSSFKGQKDLENDEAAAEISDTSTPTLHPIALCKIEFSTADPWTAFTELTCVLQASLQLSCQIKDSVSSCSIVDGVIWTDRRAGPIDWSVNLTVQNNKRQGLTPGQRIALKMWVNDTEFYLVKWVQVNEFSGLQVNRETGDIMQMSIPCTMDGFDTENESVGSLTLPDGTVWWPAP